PGLTRDDCLRFAATRSVEVRCPRCRRVREKTLSRFPPSARMPKGRHRRSSGVRCQTGELVQACPGHAKGAWAARARRQHLPMEAEHLLARAKGGDRGAQKEVTTHMRAWKAKALRARKTMPRRTGPTPGRTLGGIVRGLQSRIFTICNWCGLLIAGRASGRRFHGPCYQALTRAPEYHDAWVAMVNDPRQIRLRVRHPRLGRWMTRSVERPAATGLEGALQEVTRRRWYPGAGRVPSSAMLRLGCAAYLRRHVKVESENQIATTYRVRRQEVTHAVNVFLM